MKKTFKFFLALSLIMVVLRSDTCNDSSDDKQRDQQETILQEGTSQVGMPAIKNFRERRLLKDIYELRDQDGLVTYTYFENMNPTIVPGHTALGGKLTYLGATIGYGIPYATEFTNPQKRDGDASQVVLPQADPNGLFSPASAEGTWVMMADPNGKNDAEPVYIEPRISVFPFQLPLDK